MIIIGNKYGKLGNRLFTFAHFVANAIEHDYKISYPGFYEYSHYFKGTEKNLLTTYPTESAIKIRSRSVQWMIYKFVRLFSSYCRKLNVDTRVVKVLDISSRHDNYNLSGKEFIELREGSHVLFVTGWLFRDEYCLRKHADQVRHFFRPVDKHAANVARLIESARKDCDVLVGIHIRQGDYKTWLGGKHFYDTADYVTTIRQFRELWGEKRVKFLICSNEKQNEDLFTGLNYIWGNDNQLEDMYAFAACDYLIGPPSTYTMWASFYGAVPLFVIEAKRQQVTLEGFKVINC